MKMETQQRSPDESRKHCQVFLRTANQPIYFDFIIEMDDCGTLLFFVITKTRMSLGFSPMLRFGCFNTSYYSYGMGSIQQG